MRVFSLQGEDILGTDTWKQIAQNIIRESNLGQFGWSVSFSDEVKSSRLGPNFRTL